MSLFFLTGVGRSGTTATTKLLNSFYQVSCLHENGPKVRGRVLQGDLRLAYPKKVKGVLKEVIREVHPNKAVEDAIAIGIKVPFPDSIHDVFLLHKDVKFLCMFKHPLDLFLSQHNCDLGNTNPGWPVSVYCRDDDTFKATILNNYFNLVRNLNPQKVYMFKYEDLYTNGDRKGMVLKNILNFLGVHVSQEDAARKVDKIHALRPELKFDSVLGDVDSKHRKNFTDKAAFYKDLIWRECQHIVDIMGYKL